jgi:uncharacterized membrane protein YjgN (DUF898 family)
MGNGMSSMYGGSAVMDEAAPESREEAFEFTATGGEYFRIWIVNTLLTIVTLGIYSAWAKVRRNQYFYASTRLAGGGFEYHAQPGAILKGRIVAAMLFGGYNIALKVSPTAGLCMLALLMAVMPWLIWKSLQFALHNSSYRGIRFGFDGSAKEAYFHYLVLPVLGIFTLGLLYPFVHQRIKRFQHTRSRHGSLPFSFDAPVGGFYKAYAGLAAVYMASFALVAGSVILAAKSNAITNYMATFTPLVLMVVFWCATGLFMASIQNLVWNHTRLGGHRFRSTMTLKGLALLYATNTLGILCTLGLFTPFAAVRALKYRLECTSLVVAGSLDDIAAGQRAEIGAIGDGAADLGGIDLAL